MTIETHVTNIKRLVAGSVPEILTKEQIVLSGQNLAAYTFVESDNVGKLITHAGISVGVGNPVAGLTAQAIDATGGDTQGTLYESGNFFDDQLVWPANITTTELKLKMLEGSDIKVTFLDVGQS